MKQVILTDHQNFLNEIRKYSSTQNLKSLIRDCFALLNFTISKTINLNSTKVVKLECFFARTITAQLWDILGNPDTVKLKSCTNNIQQKQYSLCYNWHCSNYVVIDTLFPNAFKERIYSNSKGQVDFVNKNTLKGGLLIPCVNADHPLLVSYDWMKQILVLDYFFNKKKCLLDDGKIVFKEIMG